MKPSLVLFDFDGTITTRDTLLEFLKYYRGSFGYWMGMLLLSPFLVAYKLKLIPNWKAKERVLRYFLGSKEVNELNAVAEQFCKDKIPEMLRPRAVEAIENYKKSGDRIFLVSASAELWVKPVSQLLGVELIATRLEESGSRLTGRILGKNCYGPEKVARVKEAVDPGEFGEVIAYGDSRGDREMLDLADRSFYRYF